MYPNFVFDFSCSTFPLPYSCFTPALLLLYPCFTRKVYVTLGFTTTQIPAQFTLILIATASSMSA